MTQWMRQSIAVLVFLWVVRSLGGASVHSTLFIPNSLGIDPGAKSENDKIHAEFFIFTDSFNQRNGQWSLNLLSWSHNKRPLPLPTEPYDRRKHFGDWIVDGRNGNCINTRGHVLIRDSGQKVSMHPNDRCFVNTGKWHDNYTNLFFGLAGELQVDHMVPLKHAYIAGAFKWDFRTKCLFANYMGYKAHLRPVKSTENMKKSDSTPWGYLPPNSSFVCTYLADWLKIKKIWELALIPPEASAIRSAIQKYKCSSAQFEMPVDELVAQRNYIRENYRLCDYNVSRPWELPRP